jgi:hypothetical protein
MAAFNFLIGLILGYFYGTFGVIFSALFSQLFGVIIINMRSFNLLKLHFKSMIQKEEIVSCIFFLILVLLLGVRKLFLSDYIVIDIVLNTIMIIVLVYYLFFNNKYGKGILQKFV